MFKTAKFHKALTAFFAFLLIFSTAGPAPAAAQRGDGAKRQVNAESGKVSLIGPESGHLISASQALGILNRPQDPAMALAKRFGAEFGLKDPERELSEMKRNHPSDGRVVVRYQQEYQGIPVLGGELIVNTNENGDLYSINGEVSPNLTLPTQPKVDSAQAAETAVQALAKWYQMSSADFAVSQPELWIYDESLLQPSPRPIELVWRMDVTTKDKGLPVRELVLVNAQQGSISLHFNQIDTAWQSTATPTMPKAVTQVTPNYQVNPVLGSPLVSTYTASNNTSLPGTFLCNQTDPDCVAGDIYARGAHKYAIGTYNLFATQYQRDSLNNNGMTIISTVQYCAPNECPYSDAFWSGSQMVYGGKYGFPLADDIVAHELTHAVTQYESNLFSYYQSGAINESFSDLWGEYYDQSNGQGIDTAKVKWLIGEDISGLRVLRSMKNPKLYGDPDKMKSNLYHKGIADNGGVHHNSGVNNKAVYLMVDGGTFNNRTVTALGWTKVGAIYYEVNTNLLTSGADYSDLYYALQQACTNLVGLKGITAADCLEVKDAANAVQMNSAPSSSYNPDAPLCPKGYITNPGLSLFQDDLESGLGNWATSGLAWTLSSGYATSGINMLWGRDSFLSSDSRVTLTAGIPVPVAKKTFLHFKHAYRLDYFTANGTATYYDGGVLEYSTDNGATWLDAKALFSAGKNYGPALYKSSGNPLGGRPAFGGDSHGYVSSRYNLTKLAGKTVQLRWRLGTDKAMDVRGWYLDDVQVYNCVLVPPIPSLLTPTENALLTNYTPVLDWSDTTSGLDHYQVQVATDFTFTAPIYDVTTLVSRYPVTAVTPNTKYYWRVRSFNSLGDTLGWSKVLSFRAAMLPPVLTSPADLAVLTVRRPAFDWEDVTGATGYRLIISKNANLSYPIRSFSVVNSAYTPVGDLPANTVLYWGVRATGPNGPSLVSIKRSFTTGNPPSIPALILPVNNALVKIYTPLLDWNDSTLPVDTTFKHYELQVDDNNDFGSLAISIITTDGVITESSYTPLSELASNTKYYWRVRAVNDVAGVDHVSSWSKVFSFRTVILPPMLLSPTDLSTVGSLKPVFDWTAATGTGAITSYTIQVSASPLFDVLLINKPANPTFTPAVDLPAGKTLYWRVRVNGVNGPSAWSSVFSFTTP